jgi:hypothetical protein
MLRLRDGQVRLWEHMLPAEVRLLSPELATIDRLLDDARFLAPFVSRFACRIGRPTVPIETYLRLMYLAPRCALGDRWGRRMERCLFAFAFKHLLANEALGETLQAARPSPGEIGRGPGHRDRQGAKHGGGGRAEGSKDLVRARHSSYKVGEPSVTCNPSRLVCVSTDRTP